MIFNVRKSLNNIFIILTSILLIVLQIDEKEAQEWIELYQE
jgi:hypothetical protein